MKTSKVALVAAAALTVGGLAWSQFADAHTPNPSVSCSGIDWSGTQYPAGDVATLTVNGVTQTQTVGASGTFHLSGTFPGVGTSTWAYSVDSKDNQFDVSNSGSQLGCGGDTTTTAATTTTVAQTTTTVAPTTTTQETTTSTTIPQTTTTVVINTVVAPTTTTTTEPSTTSSSVAPTTTTSSPPSTSTPTTTTPSTSSTLPAPSSTTSTTTVPATTASEQPMELPRTR